MTDLEKGRAQRDARRAAAHRSTGSTTPEQAIARHLGITLYTELHRAESPKQPVTEEPDHDEPTDQ